MWLSGRVLGLNPSSAKWRSRKWKKIGSNKKRGGRGRRVTGEKMGDEGEDRERKGGGGRGETSKLEDGCPTS